MSLLEKIIGKEMIEELKGKDKFQAEQAKQEGLKSQRKENEPKKNKLVKLAILAIAALFLVGVGIGLFYWYEWRPSQIRKECNKECGGIKSAIHPRLGYDCYKDCLYKNGLKRE